MKKKLNRLDFHRLRNADHVGMNDQVSMLPAGMLSKVLPAPLAQHYISAQMYEYNCFNVLRKSAFTTDLERLERERDTVFRGFVHAVQSFDHHFDPAKREAAGRLMEALNQYGNLAALPHDAETITVFNLCETLLQADGLFFAPLQTMGLKDWIEQLITLNQAYRALERDRMDEGEANAKMNMRKARAVTDQAFRTMLDYLDMLWISADPTPELEALTDALNGITKHYEQIIHLEHPQRSEKPEDDETGGII